MSSKQKTKEFIRVAGTDGKIIKKTIYVDVNGVKYIYNQNGFYKLDDFVNDHKIV